MAQERLQIVISADSKESDRAFASTNQAMGSMEAMAARIANSISQHFVQMAAEIQRAVQGLSGVFSGLQMQASKMGGLVDQYGRPVSSGVPVAASSYGAAGGAAAGAFAGMSSADRAHRDAMEKKFWELDRQSDAQYARGGIIGQVRGGMAAGEAQKLKTELEGIDAAGRKAAAGQQEAGAATGKMGTSMTGGMMKAMVFYAAISEGVRILKEATIGSAMYAARTEQLGVALHAVSRAHGYTDEAIDKQIEKVKKLGVTTQDARQNMTRLLAARIKPDNVEEFARGAQDLGRVTGEGTSITMNRMMQASIGGEVEMTRAMGLSVNYEQAYRRMEAALNRHKDGLTETEKRQARFNEVLRASQEYAGAYAASMGTVGGSLISLQRYADEAKNAIGDRFAGALGTVVVWLTKLAKGTTETGEQWGVWIKTILIAAAAFIAYKVAMIACTAATEAFAAASAATMLTNPVFWIAAAVAALVGFGSAWLLSKDKIDLTRQAIEDNNKSLADERKELDGSNDLLEKRTKLLDALSSKELRNEQNLAISLKKEVDAQMEELRKKYESTTDPIDRSAVGTQMTNLQSRLNTLGPGVTVGAYQRRYPKYKPEDETPIAKTGVSPEDQLRKQAHAWMMAGKIQELDGLEKVNAEYQKELDLLKELAKEKKTSIPAAAMKDMAAGLAFRTADYKKDFAKQTDKINAEFALGYMKKDEKSLLYGLGSDDPIARNLEANDEIFRQNEQFQQQKISMEKSGLKTLENTEIAQIEKTNTHTLVSKLDLESQKLAVHLKYIEQEKALDVKLIEFKADMQKREFAIKNAGQEDQIRAYAALIDKQTAYLKADATSGSKEKGDLAFESANKAKVQIIYDGNKKIFDQVKNAADGVFDAMLTKSTSVWQAMANMFKVAMLTVLKEVVTSQIAKSFTGLLTGQSVKMTPAGGSSLTGPAGWLGKFLGGMGVGAQPEFGNTQQQQQQEQPQLWNIPGTGAGAGMGTSGWRDVGGGWSGVGNFAGNPSKTPALGSKSGGLSSFLGQDGSGIMGTASAKGIFGQSGSMGKYGGAVQGGLMMGGSMLAMDGWKRGGGKGMLEMAGGGAAIGMSLGGPLGAAIGAGAGAIVGGLKWAFGSDPNAEMKKRVQAITGVKIDSKDTLKSLVTQYKSSGVKLDDFIKSKMAADIIELYAMSTNQKYRNPYNLGQFNMMLSGGGIYEQASFTSGSVNSALSSLSGMGFNDMASLAAGRPSSGTQTISLKLDPAQTQTFLEGKAVDSIQKNPREVAKANTKAMDQNVNRFSIATAASPTAIMA